MITCMENGAYTFRQDNGYNGLGQRTSKFVEAVGVSLYTAYDYQMGSIVHTSGYTNRNTLNLLVMPEISLLLSGILELVRIITSTTRISVPARLVFWTAAETVQTLMNTVILVRRLSTGICITRSAIPEGFMMRALGFVT